MLRALCAPQVLSIICEAAETRRILINAYHDNMAAAQTINACRDAREKNPGAIPGQRAQQALVGGAAPGYAGHDMTTTIIT